jgi:hypothetical protein
MPEPQPERRSSRRFALNLPLTVSFAEDAGERGQDGHSKNATASQSLDVSARGICFYFDTPPASGTDLEFTLTLPAEITASDSIRVRCKGRVVRAETKPPNGKMAVAAVIHEYEFLPEA